MENASKALIMAAGVLIGILILSLAVYLFGTFGAEAAEVHKEIQSNQLVKFNSTYTIYSDRQDVTIYEIVTAANAAKENNDNYKDYGELYESGHKITITLEGEGELQNKTQAKLQELIEKYSKVLNDGTMQFNFKCVSTQYHQNGRIKSLSFKK